MVVPWNKNRTHTYIRLCKDCDKKFSPTSKGNYYCSVCLKVRTKKRGWPK